MTQFLIVACSGGADSMFLLSTALETGQKVICAHVEHGLRGQSSLRDQAFVAEYARAHNIAFETITLTPPRVGNFENWARQERYKWLHSLSDRYDNADIWTGHHADDQAESVALAILRRSWVPGLAGIAPVQGVIHRPLLSITKKEILMQCQQRDIPFVHDETNDSVLYMRNRVRRLLLPIVEARFPDAKKCLCRIAERSRTELWEYQNRAANTINQVGVEAFLSQLFLYDVSLQLWGLRQIFGWYLSQADRFLIECSVRKKGNNLHFGNNLFRHVGTGVRILPRDH